VVLDDSAGGQKAETGSFAGAFRREEVGEELLAKLGINAISVVFDFEDNHPLAFSRGQRDSPVRFVAHVTCVECIRY
jgi:hypothetical protein